MEISCPFCQEKVSGVVCFNHPKPIWFPEGSKEAAAKVMKPPYEGTCFRDGGSSVTEDVGFPTVSDPLDCCGEET